MVMEIDESTIARRHLILRDALAILSLTLVTVALFVVTLLLFRSFTAHRADLAQRWSTRGRQALQADRPVQAIVALRTALSYAPGTRAYELLLAEALGEAGRTEESYQYFMGLWVSEPGNGRINLELARLAAKRNEHQAAVNFYRASIYGTWEGDGVARRAAVRLELARYLIAQHDFGSAKMELLIAGGNAPDDYDRDMTLGLLLQQAGDPTDASTYYHRAVKNRPDDPSALEAAGRLAYQTGDYESAHRLLERSQTEAAKQGKAPLGAGDVALMNESARMTDLVPAPTLPTRIRVARILAMRAIARKRMATCDAQFATGSELPQTLRALKERWAGEDGTLSAAAPLRDSERQNSIVRLVYDTEVETEKLCGPPTGDDALLLRLATTSPSSQTPLNSADAAGPEDNERR
jgi:tetratricopeptide (TPR) repeat protein